MERSLVFFVVVVSLAAGVALTGCESDGRDAPDSVRGPSETLEEPKGAGEMSLDEALESRRSQRSFAERDLADEQVAWLLWAAQGVTSPEGYRTAPSAGALYPLELYVVRGGATYHYLPEENETEKVAEGIESRSLTRAALGQSYVGSAPALFVVTAVFERTESKYGDRGERYVHMEAGHAAQNILLEATALGLGAVPIGAFDDQLLSEILDLPGDHAPLYLIPVGHRP